MFSEDWVADNHPIIKAVCSICKKKTNTIACMNNMHLGLIGRTQNYHCHPGCKPSTPIILQDATWEAAWLNSELGKAQVPKEENISPQTAGIMI